jgi:Flp pilus assembly protein TadG
MMGAPSHFMRRIRQDRTGAAVIEAAIAVPIIIALVMGIVQMGMFFVANAGVRQAVEKGARFATLFPTPTDDAIKTRVGETSYGLDRTKLTVATPVRGKDAGNGQNFIEVTATYPYKFNFIFYASNSITIRYTRRIYLMPT